MKTIKITVLQGVLGDMAAEWMTPKDWAKHTEYVKKLGNDYGKPVEYEVSFMENPKADDPRLTTSATVSYRMEIVDFNTL